jgi:ABC-type lipoprotein release transport system permease subunit
MVKEQKMLISLAWKNVWRNKKRSLIILAAIAFGLWGGLMSGSIMMGMGESMVETAINRNLAHIQIHDKSYTKENEIFNFIPDGFKVIEQVRTIDGVKAVSGRTIIEGMAASPTSTYGVKIIGIEPQQAKQVTDIHEKIVKGKKCRGNVFFD